ncbi:hypothetical protein CAL65_14635 [Alkalilimnicola ehrlichii]|uniref:Carrier domain-containing protein n=2 Tax=Alkalilimnicola ehrlichii TaxID=351052 RepID=A0A3E0WQB6_9GAMM|nr:hypothetical protein CAL65_14635 [Alkalilimnicola ehrlichii]
MWFYRPVWRITLPQEATDADGDWLVVGDSPVCGKIATQLRAMNRSVTVVRSEADRAPAESVLQASPAGSRLFVVYVAHGADSWRSQPELMLPLTAYGSALTQFASTYQWLTRAVAAERISLAVLTEGVYRDPAEGVEALTTAVTIAAQEQPGLRAKHIDFAEGNIDLDCLLREAQSDSTAAIVYRGGERYELQYCLAPASRPNISAGRRPYTGVCLITGGLGTVGHVVAQHVGRAGARILIVGRTDISGTDSAACHARERLQALHAAGIEAHYERADVACGEQLEKAVRAGEAALGEITSVVHAAAAIDGDRFLGFLHELTPAALNTQLAPKVAGLVHLDRLLGNRRLAFRCIFSSNSVLLGGLGYAAYATANALVGAVADELNRRRGEGGLWQVIEWDVWEVTARKSAHGAVQLGTASVAAPMPTAEALECLDRLLEAGDVRTLVSVTDLVKRSEVIRMLLSQKPAQDEADGGAKAGPEPDRQATGESLVELARRTWQRALRTQVTDEASFVELGGDSLSAIKVVLEVNRRLGTALSPRDMLQAATFKDFVLALTEAVSAASATVVPSWPSSQPAQSVASMLQERWFAMDRRGYGHLAFAVEIGGPLDLHLARTALGVLSRRHAVLRTRYRPGDVLMQELMEETSPVVKASDVSTEPSRVRAAAVRDALERTASRFSLTEEVPFQVELMRIEPERHRMFGRMHHIAVDGWSFTLMLEDFERIYAVLEQGGDPSLIPPAPQYAHFANAQRRYLDSPEIIPVRQYWQRHFAGVGGPTKLPVAERPDLCASGDPEAARSISVTVESEQLARLAGFAHKRRSTLFPVLAAAFALMLRDATGETDLVFGTTAAGRHLPGTDSMLGVFVNPLPLRVTLDDPSDIDASFRSVNDSLLGFHNNQNYLLQDLIENVEPFVGLDINEAFHAYILYQNFPKSRPRGAVSTALKKAKVLRL